MKKWVFKKRKAVKLALFLSILSACLFFFSVGAVNLSFRDSQSEVIYPLQEIPIQFSHKTHIKEAGASCVSCHDKVEKSSSAADRNLPKMEVCLNCHPLSEANYTGSCQKCHPKYTPKLKAGLAKPNFRMVEKWPPLVVIPTANLKFSHSLHASNKVTCKQCHPDVENVKIASRKDLLFMEACLKCHSKNKASTRCISCHLADQNFRVQTQYTAGILKPKGSFYNDNHDMLWSKGHRNAAKLAKDYCYQCHPKENCLKCHGAVMRPLKNHPNDWGTLHPIHARKNSMYCGNCHRYQSFCKGCHQKTQYTDRLSSSKTQALSPLKKYHPVGWGSTTRNLSHHSVHAQRNIRTCVSCHSEKSCTRCHSGKTMKIKPHPKNWKSMCKRLLGRNTRACVKCHFGASWTSVQAMCK